MQPLSAQELLEVWERGRTQPPVEQPLTLLAQACPELSRDRLARLPIGERNRRLLNLRAWTFGLRLEASAVCPRCGQRVEIEFTASDLLSADVPATADTVAMEADGYRVAFRFPDSLDLADAARAGDIGAARLRLRDRCFVAVWHGGDRIPVADLPETVEAAVVERMEAADPLADTQLELQCAACQSRWQAAFHVAYFFWLEIDAWARRILQEVHTLASAYGWSEGQILGLSPLRRQCYLEMVGG